MILTVNGLSDMENGIRYINRDRVRIHTTMMDQGLFDQYVWGLMGWKRQDNNSPSFGFTNTVSYQL